MTLTSTNEDLRKHGEQMQMSIEQMYRKLHDAKKFDLIKENIKMHSISQLWQILWLRIIPFMRRLDALKQ